MIGKLWRLGALFLPPASSSLLPIFSNFLQLPLVYYNPAELLQLHQDPHGHRETVVMHTTKGIDLF